MQYSAVLSSWLWICMLIHACTSANSSPPVSRSSALSLSALLDSLVQTYEINFRPQWIAMTSPTGNLCLCIVDFRSGVRDMYLTRCLPDRCLYPSGGAGTEGQKLLKQRTDAYVDVAHWFHVHCCQKTLVIISVTTNCLTVKYPLQEKGTKTRKKEDILNAALSFI